MATVAPAVCLAATAPNSGYRSVLDKYCVTCHNQRLKTGGLALDGNDLENVSAHAELWEKVIRKLQARLMPPPGMPRPDEATYNSAVTAIETQIDRAAEANPQPGRPTLHRLNRSEYANAIRDLLDLEIDPAALLPPDDSAYGFDNISDVLGVSPSFQEHYLSAALKIGALAVGDGNVTPGSETFRIRQDLSQDRHIEGLPLGTIGGIAVRHNFPLDGAYVFQAKLYRTNLNIMRGLETAHQVEFAVDGERILLASFGGPEELAFLFKAPTETGDSVDARLRTRVRVKAGPHVVTAAFLANTQAAEPLRLEPYIRSSVDNFDWSGHPHLQVLTIAGPFDATGPGDTPSRRRIFICHPENPQAETLCAKHIITTLVRRAYREPPRDADIERVMKFYQAGRRDGGFEGGIELAIERILASPKFLFRTERDPASVAPGSVYAIGDIELASRLSFFLWSSIPDDELLRVVSHGKLHASSETSRTTGFSASFVPAFGGPHRTPVGSAEFNRQVERMLADPRAAALTTNFAGQWLQLRNVPNVQPNSDEFPDFDENLRRSMRLETEMLFESIVKENRSILDLLTADYTFVDERLARHYGIPDIYGSHFRRIRVADNARRGLLGQASILALTSHATRTSPVVRGKWILENLMGTPVPPPPPDVPPLKENQEGERPRTLREQMLEHRANAVCASCHKVMDPIGFALENFDAVGAWRTQDAGNPIDVSGQLADGTKVDGIVELRNAIVSRPEVFATAFTEKLLTYALGRGLDYRDMPAVRAIVRDAAEDHYRFSAFISGVVHSVPFRMRMAAPVTTETAQAR